jgi:succinate-semialdehyde dehydrogenase/glutarate-semialdehyde dehydrogenase
MSNPIPTSVPSINPATLEIFGSVLEHTVEDLHQAIGKARVAQHEWATTTFTERKKRLRTVRDYIVEHADRIAEVISMSTGKTRMDAMSTEVLAAAMSLSYYASHAKKILKRKHLGTGNILLINKRSYIDRVPFGVVGIISPWNYPLAIPFHEVAIGLMAGNGVILKVASHTLEVGKIIESAVNAGGYPEGLFSLINLPGAVAGNAFIDEGIDKLFFTGSVATGKILMAKAAERLIPVSLELGGNDAMIICADADVNRAVAGALWAGLSNSGQSCAGVERIFVAQEIYEPFLALLKQEMAKLRHGVDTDFNVEIGSLTTKAQLKKVQELVADAVAKGARIYESGTDSTKGYFHKLMIVENADESMRVMQEEIFGPVLAVMKVENMDRAVKAANNSLLGLTASVWTRSRATAHLIAGRLQAGAISINDHLMTHGLAETPWGGFKQSGIGRTHGHLGLEEMTQPRVVIDDILPGVKRNMWWYPHNKKVYEGLRGAMEFLYSKNFKKRVEGSIRLVKVFIRTFTRG